MKNTRPQGAPVLSSEYGKKPPFYEPTHQGAEHEAVRRSAPDAQPDWASELVRQMERRVRELERLSSYEGVGSEAKKELRVLRCWMYDWSRSGSRAW